MDVLQALESLGDGVDGGDPGRFMETVGHCDVERDAADC